ncbi:SAM-dependent methyltransferase [Anderseniella sp. Alg231-50]|uniref:SAM-dependent methyltransferase n=1 Tax=Anderseniella sp. Alg231-50 TaxID=1922226 RepID=UPI000D54BC87
MSKPKPETVERQSALGTVIADMIAADGPVPVDRYMALALGHERHGYYMGRDPFGRAGDFITAPEVSQMFGELVGIWCAAGWQMMDAPAEWNLIELGPGRGTLLADLVRACSVMPGLRDGMKVHLVETSPALKTMQGETLKRAGIDATWHDRLEDVPDGQSLIIANEFFDALPVSQLQKQAGHWHERVVGLGQDGKLAFGVASDPVAPALVPPWAAPGADGDIAEFSPARDAVAREIGRRITRDMGAALIIDYGHMRSAAGDTLQAIRKHQFADVLAQPGEADITSHVDFEALTAAVTADGAKPYGPVMQGDFLIKMGLKEREEMLRVRADARQRIRLSKGAQRLVSGNQMGQLFKVLAVTHPDMPKPAPFNVEPA